MTSNQINYHNMMHTAAHYERQDAETNRSNLAKERETNRANVAMERETNRANLAKEYETNRTNVANEGIKREQNAINWQNAATNARQADIASARQEVDERTAGYNNYINIQRLQDDQKNNAVTRLMNEAKAGSYAAQATKLNTDTANYWFNWVADLI